MEHEQWRKINESIIQDYYEVSDHGRIRNIETGKILVNSFDKNGYHLISLQRKDGLRKTYKVHRLVLIAFGDFNFDPERYTVNHENGIKYDNHISNLSWMNLSEQQQHSIRTGLKTIKYGKNAPNTKYDEMFIRQLKMCIDFNIKPSEISRILDIPNDKKLSSLLYRIKYRHWSSVD